MNTKYKFTLVIPFLLLIMGCNNGPKVISASDSEEADGKGSGIFTPDPAIHVNPDANQPFSNDLHTVVVNEMLPTERYIYLRVSEGGKEFWIATRKQDIEKGATYFYRGGLLKTNFESKEYKRVFDTIYLVSNLVAEDHSKHAASLDGPGTKTPQVLPAKEDIPTHTEKVVEHKGTLKISELLKDPGKFEGHTVQISGTCVKVNPNIMDRNWIHIQDGSKDDFDLVVTSRTFVPEGSAITIRAVVSINRDFGAGYKYDLILENGTLVQ